MACLMPEADRVCLQSREARLSHPLLGLVECMIRVFLMNPMYFGGLVPLERRRKCPLRAAVP